MVNLILSPSNLVVEYGDQVELTCQTNQIHPFDLQWLHNGHLFHEKQLIRYAYDRSILHIEQTNENHNGIYQCFSNRTFHDETINSNTMTLFIRRKLKRKTNLTFISSSFDLAPRQNQSQSQTVNSGDRLTLSCEIDPTIEGNFLGTVEWFHNGSPVKSDSHHRNRIDYRNGTLTIEKTSVEKIKSIQFVQKEKLIFSSIRFI